MTNSKFIESRKSRLKRLVHLRELQAPAWVIRCEQANLALVRKGLRTLNIKKPGQSRKAQELFDKYVKPLMEGGI